MSALAVVASLMDMNAEQDRLDARVKATMEQWPTLSESSACVNCDQMFRVPVNGHCPLCGSESVFNVTEMLSKRRKRKAR